MGTSITQTGGRIPAARDDIPHWRGIPRRRRPTNLETMTSRSDPSLPGTRGRWLLLGLSSLFAVYLVLLVVQPAGTSEVVRWLYNILLVGAAFVCLTSPHQRGRERAAWRCIGTTLLLWAAGDFYYTLFLLDATVSPPTVTDVLWLVSYPILYAGIGLLVRARTVHFERSLWLDAALAALAVAAVGAAVLFGDGRREHGRLAADRGDERGVSACRRTAARHGRRRPRDHRLAARPRLAVHPRQHGRARACGQRRPLPGCGRLDGRHRAARRRVAARDAPPRRRLLAARRPARCRPRRGRTGAGAARGLRPDLARDPRLRTVRAAEQAGSHPRGHLDAGRDRTDGLHLPREDAAARDDPRSRRRRTRSRAWATGAS